MADCNKFMCALQWQSFQPSNKTITMIKIPGWHALSDDDDYNVAVHHTCVKHRIKFRVTDAIMARYAGKFMAPWKSNFPKRRDAGAKLISKELAWKTWYVESSAGHRYGR